MKNWGCLAMFVSLVGCVAPGEDATEAHQELTRPPLSSICSYACNSSHQDPYCSDTSSAFGSVNVSVFPLIEGKPVVPATPIGNLGSWATTSCPNCQWSVTSVIDSNGVPANSSWISRARNDVNVQRSGDVFLQWSANVDITIADPTDASVGVCNLSVPIELTLSN